MTKEGPIKIEKEYGALIFAGGIGNEIQIAIHIKNNEDNPGEEEGVATIGIPKEEFKEAIKKLNKILNK